VVVIPEDKAEIAVADIRIEQEDEGTLVVVVVVVEGTEEIIVT
jgi:hypothetical protein